jgi:DNA-binding protein Fis
LRADKGQVSGINYAVIVESKKVTVRAIRNSTKAKIIDYMSEMNVFNRYDMVLCSVISRFNS